jgi:DNA primase catalytic subunit
MSLYISIPLKSKIATLTFDLDSTDLQYFQGKSERKLNKTLLNVKATQVMHNIACLVTELDFGGVLI